VIRIRSSRKSTLSALGSVKQLLCPTRSRRLFVLRECFLARLSIGMRAAVLARDTGSLIPKTPTDVLMA